MDIMKYEALINGSNFLLDHNGKFKKHGFYQTVYVESTNPSEAELKAIEVLKNNPELMDLTKNKPNDPPKLNLDEIKEVEGFQELQILELGGSFYPEKKWWMVWR